MIVEPMAGDSVEENFNQMMPFDCVVIGGGPGGSAAATRLAQMGRKTAIVESEVFPRFHIGESLLPMSNQVFQELGLYDKIVDCGFPEKWGAIFYDQSGSREVIFDFGESPVFGGKPTYHVPRAEFDQLLLDHAVSAGAQRIVGRVSDVQFDSQGVSLQIQQADQSEFFVRASCVLDASGRSGFLAKKFQLRLQDKTLQKAAVYAHFKGVPRPEGRHAGSIRIVSTENLGWIWLIPLPQNVMSMGVVMDMEFFKKQPKGEPEQILMENLMAVPAVSRLLGEAERISPVHIESSFSYGTQSYVGDRWMMVGDAGSFLDPVFSSGVMFALFAGVEAAQTLEKAFALKNFSAELFLDYNRVQQARYCFFRRFVRGFYHLHFRELFYNPTPKMGMMRAVVTVLGGAWDLSFMDRLRVEFFFQLVRLQRFFPLAPQL